MIYIDLMELLGLMKLRKQVYSTVPNKLGVQIVGSGKNYQKLIRGGGTFIRHQRVILYA